MHTLISSLLDISTSDPDDSRRRKLLSILLLVTEFLTILIIISLIIFKIFGYGNRITVFVWWAAFGQLTGIAIFYWINRNPSIPGWIPPGLFLLFLLLLFSFTDTPTQLVAGRSLFVFTIPIIMSSILLYPSSSFIFAALVSVEISILANLIGKLPNPFAVISFFLIALVSWLSARSLEQALKELREINANLDNLVEQKTQELATALSRELILSGRNRAILESIADGVLVLDPEGIVIQANPAFSVLLGIPYGKLNNITIDEISYDDQLDAKSRGVLTDLLTRSKKLLSSYRLEWGPKTLSISSAQVLDDSGETVGTVAVFRDFTREAEVERLKSSFVAMVSHELRTPLNAILGYAEMFKEAVYGPVNPKQSNMAERIINNTRRLLGLVSDLLDQAQIEAGRITIRISSVKPAELIDNVHSLMDKTISEKGLKLFSEIDPALPASINGDPDRLQQIIINLTNNAVKFTTEGTIKVRLYKPQDNKWSIEVSDTGAGIPEAEISHIFEPFRQVEDTAKRAHGGFGLGLSIVKQLANLMSGKIAVQSKVGEGSTFTVTLPLIASTQN